MEQIEIPSFENILSENHERIWRLCRAYTTSAEDARDLFQEVALHIWTGLKTFKGQAAIGTWVYRIAVNTAINYSISRRRDGQNLSLHLVDFAVSTEAKEDDRVEVLYRFVNRLNAADRALITLYLEDFSNKEIAEVTGISENYVAVKLLRIRNKLSEYFKDK